MKRVIAVLMFAMLLTALPFNLGFGQDAPPAPEGSVQFAYLGYDYSGMAGVTFGYGFTFNKVTILPIARVTFSDTAETSAGLNYEKSAGIEVIYWAVVKPTWKLGLVGSPASVEWLEQQDKDLPEYVAQALGMAGVWYLNENVAVVGALKGTTQLLDKDSIFKERLRFNIGLSAKLQLFGSK